MLVQLILLNISSSLYAYKLTHFYSHNDQRSPKGSANVLVRTWRIFAGPRFVKAAPGALPGFPFDSVSLKLSNGDRIHGWYSETDSAGRGTVILFHGVTSQKSHLLYEASAFRSLGLNVLLVDFRGHGRSEGRKTTLGVREAEEVKMAWDFISAKGEKNIYLYGVSMGAVAVSRAVWKYGLDAAAVFLEMPFASLKSHLRARARTLGFPGFPEKPFSFLVSHWIGWEQGFNGPQHRTTRYAGKVHCPVLLQWGEKDELVLREETLEVYHSLASRQKKMVTYPGAGHESLYRSDEEKWKNTVRAFLR